MARNFRLFDVLFRLTHTLGTLILFTVICLAMAGHFQSVLAASDLSEEHLAHRLYPFPLILIHFFKLVLSRLPSLSAQPAC